jgi:hypothetical protein
VNLKELKMNNDNIVDISPLYTLKKLEKLDLMENLNLVDYTVLKVLPNLNHVILNEWDPLGSERLAKLIAQGVFDYESE